MRRIAEPRFECRSLQTNTAGIAIAEAGNSGVFLAEAYAAGQQNDGRIEPKTAKIER
jgi:hypothetical protein